MTAAAHPQDLPTDKALTSDTDTAARPLVRMEGVTKRYGDLTVLANLDLTIGQGEIVSIIGPSGSGKTTVLRALMTLETIDEGVSYIGDTPLTHTDTGNGVVPASERYMRKVRSNIGMVFQHFNLFPHMTALGNCIEGPIQVLKMPRKEAIARAEELLRPAATGGHRPRAGHEAPGHAAVRGDSGAGSRSGGRGAGGHPRPGPRP